MSANPVIAVNAIGLFRMTDEQGRDDKILCVPCEDPSWSHVSSRDELPSQVRDEIAHFFSIYKQPEGHSVEMQGWFPREQALMVIEDSRGRWAAEARP